MIEFILLVVIASISNAVCYRWGFRAGLRAPLSKRMAAARADLSRSEAALGALPPRVRKGDYSRTRRRR